MGTMTVEEKDALKLNAAHAALNVLNHPDPFATYAEPLVSAVVAQLGVVTVAGEDGAETRVVRVVDEEGRPRTRWNPTHSHDEPLSIEKLIEETVGRDRSLRWTL